MYMFTRYIYKKKNERETVNFDTRVCVRERERERERERPDFIVQSINGSI